METQFQTSFIPKKPLPSVGTAGVSIGVPTRLKPSRAGSWLLNIGILLFVVSLGAGGAVYAWKTVLSRNQESYKQQLADRQKQFNPALIQQLKQANTKIDSAKQILSSHIALSNIFDIISRLTIEKVRFLSMDATTPSIGGAQGANGQQAGANSSDVQFTLTGYGANLSAVAFQAEVLGELEKYGLQSIVKNPVVSEPAIDENGLVSFSFTAEIDPANLIYMKGTSQQ